MNTNIYFVLSARRVQQVSHRCTSRVDRSTLFQPLYDNQTYNCAFRNVCASHKIACRICNHNRSMPTLLCNQCGYTASYFWVARKHSEGSVISIPPFADKTQALEKYGHHKEKTFWAIISFLYRLVSIFF